jgi:small subunit ribosomal protein S21
LAEIRLQEGESIENALRSFKRKVQTEDIIKAAGGEALGEASLGERKRARKKTRQESVSVAPK